MPKKIKNFDAKLPKNIENHRIKSFENRSADNKSVDIRINNKKRTGGISNEYIRI